MSSAVMMERNRESSPRFKARVVGVCWLMTVVTGTAALFTQGTPWLVVVLLANICYVATSLCIADLMRPVNRDLSLLSALLGVAGCMIGVGSILHVASLVAIGGGRLGFVFFGLQCALIGYLILRSTFLPRFLGVLMTFGGLGWLTLGLSSTLAPQLARTLSPYIMFPGIVGEVSLTLWLLVAGVNVGRWYELAGDSR